MSKRLSFIDVLIERKRSTVLSQGHAINAFDMIIFRIPWLIFFSPSSQGKNTTIGKFKENIHCWKRLQTNYKLNKFDNYFLLYLKNTYHGTQFMSSVDFWTLKIKYFVKSSSLVHHFCHVKQRMSDEKCEASNFKQTYICASASCTFLHTFKAVWDWRCLTRFQKQFLSEQISQMIPFSQTYIWYCFCNTGYYEREKVLKTKKNFCSNKTSFFSVHYQKIIHRDLKPSNLLRSDTGEVKIADLVNVNFF